VGGSAGRCIQCKPKIRTLISNHNINFRNEILEKMRAGKNWMAGRKENPPHTKTGFSELRFWLSWVPSVCVCFCVFVFVCVCVCVCVRWVSIHTGFPERRLVLSWVYTHTRTHTHMYVRIQVFSVRRRLRLSWVYTHPHTRARKHTH
jgi:hypothetical protein